MKIVLTSILILFSSCDHKAYLQKNCSDSGCRVAIFSFSSSDLAKYNCIQFLRLIKNAGWPGNYFCESDSGERLVN